MRLSLSSSVPSRCSCRFWVRGSWLCAHECQWRHYPLTAGVLSDLKCRTGSGRRGR
ncbi:SWIM zinc finger family protein [Pseudomonas sp. C9]|uniref:SWIM zinc finger family protein n=1 Tax=Pseudomonas sp. C9 TaxID=1311337 RepID=UPI003532428F